MLGVHTIQELVGPPDLTASTSQSSYVADCGNSLTRPNIKEALSGVAMVRRWDLTETDDYPYRSHGQPVMAWCGLTGCLIILLVANGAPLWGVFTVGNFLGAYLAVGRG